MLNVSGLYAPYVDEYVRTHECLLLRHQQPDASARGLPHELVSFRITFFNHVKHEFTCVSVMHVCARHARSQTRSQTTDTITDVLQHNLTPKSSTTVHDMHDHRQQTSRITTTTMRVSCLADVASYARVRTWYHNTKCPQRKACKSSCS